MSSINKALIIISISIVTTINSSGQPKFPKPPTLNDVKKEFDRAGDIIKTVASFSNAKQRSTQDFNKTVVVININNANKNRNSIPSDQITEPKIKRGHLVNMNWEPVAYFDNQLFPSMIISMATFKGPISGELSAIKSSALGFRFLSNHANMPLKWEIECTDKKYFDKQEGTYFYENAGQEYYFMPNIAWNYETLAKQQTSTPINVYYRLYTDDGKKVEKLVTLTLRSINDCVRFYKDIDLRFMYAAYVNEEHPEIDNILREGLKTKMVKAWTGESGGATQIRKQVAAIWRVLHDRGFAYSSITETIGDEGNILSQSIRTFDKALKTNQANCVDGTVVFASILKKIGISPVMVLVPGHCFLGYYTDRKNNQIEYLETTMLSSSQYIVKAKTSQQVSEAYQKEFAAATVEAREEYKIQTTKNPNDIILIDVTKERRKIKPIPVYN